jgi:hypothetical protein
MTSYAVRKTSAICPPFSQDKRTVRIEHRDSGGLDAAGCTLTRPTGDARLLS